MKREKKIVVDVPVSHVEAANKLGLARTRLILDNQWFGSLALRLNLVADPKAKKAVVNGVDFRFNPEWAIAQDPPILVGAIAKATLHCALLHMSRRGLRDRDLFNDAATHIVNALLVEEKFKLPKDTVIDSRFAGMSVEKAYAILEAEQRKDESGGDDQGEGAGGGGGSDQGDPGDNSEGDSGNDADSNPVEVDDAPEVEAAGEGEDQQTDVETSWKIAVEIATNVAAKAGRLPAGAKILVDTSRESQVDWRTALRRFVSRPGDYSWTSPSRRFVGAGIYLPGAIKTRPERLVIFVDTSGSTRLIIPQFGAEIRDMFQSIPQPEETIVIYIDAAICKIDRFSQDDEIVFSPAGGGGTLFAPGFEYVEAEDIRPDAAIYLTDMECYDSPQEPSYPVLWIAPESATTPAPFGELVFIPAVR